MILAAQQDDGWSPNWATHPGEHLEEYLDVRGWSQADFVRLSGLNKKLVSEIISCKNPVTPETAIVLERVLGTKAYIWTGLQSNWDLFQARKQKSRVAPETRAWVQRFPLKELSDAGVITDSDDEEECLDSLLRFLGIGTPAAYEAKQRSLDVRHRQGEGDVSNEHIFSWLMIGEHRARTVNLPAFEVAKFKDAVYQIRQMTREHPRVFEPKMVELCRAAGVALAFEPAISKTRLFGSARWLDANRALIQMSLRMKKNDHFWWTFFHECAHLILHKGQNFADDAPGVGDQVEIEANSWAEEALVGRNRFARFVQTRPRTKVQVMEFAEEVGIHPGIVVGMLQHKGVIEYRYMNDLKDTFELRRT
jgi:HTH-type transcriptional regulator/antitoxin HigA